MKDTQVNKLVTIVRNDLTNGQQLAQSIHSATEFAHKHPNLFNDWMTTSQYVVSLSVDNEEKLKDIFDKLKYFGANIVSFCEPDINNQWTVICYYGTPELRKITQKLDLALNN